MVLVGPVGWWWVSVFIVPDSFPRRQFEDGGTQAWWLRGALRGERDMRVSSLRLAVPVSANGFPRVIDHAASLAQPAPRAHC